MTWDSTTNSNGQVRDKKEHKILNQDEPKDPMLH